MQHGEDNSGFYKSDIVVQFSKDKQYGLNGTKCEIYTHPTDKILFEVSQKCVNGSDQYSARILPSVIGQRCKNCDKGLINRLWLYCVGLVLIAAGLCLIVVGTLKNIKGSMVTVVEFKVVQMKCNRFLHPNEHPRRIF